MDVKSLSAFTGEMRDLARRGRLNDALSQVAEFVVQVISRDSSIGTVFGSPELDALCLELGRGHAPSPEGAPSDTTAVLATAVAGMGGHSRQIFDIAEVDPSKRVVVLITNVMNEMKTADLKTLFEGQRVETELAPVGNLASTLFWLQDRLRDLRPRRTYVLQHHFDSVIVAALQPELTGELYFAHNADHSLCLGVHVPHAKHIDFHPKGFYNCRHREKVPDNYYWPLTANVPVMLRKRDFLHEGRLVTCCAGGFEKFELPHLKEAFPYEIQYEQVVASTLSATGGRHIHIGPLSSNMLGRIVSAMEEAGAAEERFDHVQRVPNLAQALNDLHVDVYMGSMPRGGGRATVEAMGVGLPLLIHSNYRTLTFSDENEAYPGALVWRTLPELTAHLAAIDMQLLQAHQSLSRSWYESRYRHDILRREMEKTLAGEPSALPPMPDYRPNALQAFLDLQARQLRDWT